MVATCHKRANRAAYYNLRVAAPVPHMMEGKCLIMKISCLAVVAPGELPFTHHLQTTASLLGGHPVGRLGMGERRVNP